MFTIFCTEDFVQFIFCCRMIWSIWYDIIWYIIFLCRVRLVCCLVHCTRYVFVWWFDFILSSGYYCIISLFRFPDFYKFNSESTYVKFCCNVVQFNSLKSIGIQRSIYFLASHISCNVVQCQFNSFNQYPTSLLLGFSFHFSLKSKLKFNSYTRNIQPMISEFINLLLTLLYHACQRRSLLTWTDKPTPPSSCSWPAEIMYAKQYG